MRKGGAKRKGSKFERDICGDLSYWVTEGQSTDVFWRSAMSGGRATVAHKKGKLVRQAGDISSVGPEGHQLTDNYYFELKHYKDLQIASFFSGAPAGKLYEFWQHARLSARKHRRRPILIARQNYRPVLVLTSRACTWPYSWVSGRFDCKIGTFTDFTVQLYTDFIASNGL